MKKSYNQLSGIILGKLILFLGIGGILSMALALSKTLPDTAGWCVVVVSPFLVLGIIYCLLTCCNSISFEGERIVIDNFQGRKIVYSTKDLQDVEVVEHRSSGVLMGYTLVLTMGGQQPKKWRLSGYTESTIDEILKKLGDESKV